MSHEDNNTSLTESESESIQLIDQELREVVVIKSTSSDIISNEDSESSTTSSDIISNDDSESSTTSSKETDNESVDNTTIIDDKKSQTPPTLESAVQVTKDEETEIKSESDDHINTTIASIVQVDK